MIFLTLFRRFLRLQTDSLKLNVRFCPFREQTPKCHELETAPIRGQRRDDLMENLRVAPIDKKAVAAFIVDEEKQAVLVLNIFYGGRDYEALMAESPTGPDE